MKFQNKHKPSSDLETAITISDSAEFAMVESSQLPIMRLLRQICAGPTGAMIKDHGNVVECVIDKRHISLNDKAYSPRKT